MDFEDIFEKSNAYHKKHGSQEYYRGNRYNHDEYSEGQDFSIIQFIKNNRKLKIAVIALFIIAIILIVGLIAILLPLAGKIIDYITQNGVSGVVEVIQDFLNNLWNGTK